MSKFTLRFFLIAFLSFGCHMANGQVARFTVDDTAGCVTAVTSKLIHFTNTSVGATSYSWNFGNGAPVSTYADPSTSFSAGTYTVTLTASNGTSTSTYSKVISLYLGPTINFSATDTATCLGKTIAFASSVIPNAWGSVTYTWNFGDGSSSNLNSPSHSYATPGYYTVTLFAVNGPGCTSTAIKPAYIHANSPVPARFSTPTTTFCTNPSTAVFTSTVTATGPYTYLWNFGDGGSSSSAAPNHTYTATGNYNVTLKVIDGNKCLDTFRRNSYIHLNHLVAGFTSPTVACAFSSPATGFVNTSTAHTSSRWSFGDGAASISNLTASHVYTASGTVPVKLVVFDGTCYDSTTQPLTVDLPPTGDFTISPLAPCPAPATLAFNAIVSPGNTVKWNFGDTAAVVTGLNVSHTYPAAVIDYIKMTITNITDGCSTIVPKKDTINSLNRKITAFPSHGCVPLSVRFTNVDTSVVYKAITSHYTNFADTSYLRFPYPYADTSYSWDFGDGSPVSTSPSPTHLYTVPGIFTATCTVYTANGCGPFAYTVIDSVSTYPLLASFTSSKPNACYGDTVYYTGTVNDSIDVYSLDFRDGSVITGTHIDSITHVFTTPGTFTPVLTVTHIGCSQADSALTDTVYGPKAIMKSSSACSPRNQVTFINASLQADSHVWLFGDGDTSSADTVVYTYPDFSSYTASLITFSSFGCTDTAKIPLTFGVPSVSFTSPETIVCRDQADTFVSNVSGPGTPVLRYAWYVGGSPAINTRPIMSSPSVGTTVLNAFHVNGPQTVSLVITDSLGCLDTFTRTNYITVTKPVANFVTANDTSCSGAVLFTDSSNAAGLTFARYTWSFGDGAVTPYTVPTATHNDTTSTYNVQEIVTDNIGCSDTAIQSKTFVKYQTKSKFTFSGTGCMGQLFGFNNTSTGATNYLWNFGNGDTSSAAAPNYSYSAAATYTVTLIAVDAVNGCAPDTLVKPITVYSSPSASYSMSDSFTVCPPLLVAFTNTSSGGLAPLTYMWDLGDGAGSSITNANEIYNTPNKYMIKLVATDARGCMGTYVDSVSVFGYDGAFTFSPSTACSPSTPITFTVNGTVGPNILRTWDFGDGYPDSGSLSNTVTHIYATTHPFLPKLYLTDLSSGCQSSSTGLVSLAVDSVVADFTSTTPNFCQDRLTFFNDASTSPISAMASWLWSFGTGDTSILSAPTYTFTISDSFTVSLKVTDTLGCTNSTSKIIYVNRMLPPIFGTDSMCMGKTAALSDTGATGTWSSGDLTIATVDAVSGVVTGVASGTASITYSSITGCLAIDTVQVLSLPNAGIIEGIINGCPGLTLTLSDATPGGMWSSGNTSVATIGTASGLLQTFVSGTSKITYTTVPDQNGCINSTTVALTVLNGPAYTITGNVAPAKCYGGNNGGITTTVNGGSGTYQYLWSNGATTAQLSDLVSGKFILHVTEIPTQCTRVDSFQVTQPDSFAITGDVINDNCQKGNGKISIEVTGGTSPYNYLWADNSTGKEISGLKPGSYTISIMDVNYCQKSVSMIVEEGDCDAIDVHTGISPNGDGINDTWTINGLEKYATNTVQIFDKWGDMVYEKKNYSNDWAGTSTNGNLLPDGTYFYVVKLNAVNVSGGKDTYTGSVFIKRK